MNIILLKLTLIFYFLAPLFYLVSLAGRDRFSGKIGFFLQIAGFFFHTHFILVYLWRKELLGPLSSVSGTLFLLSWIVVLSLLIMEIFYKLKQAIGPFASPLAFALFILSLLHPVKLFPLPPAFQGVWFVAHLAFVLIALALFSVLFGLSVMYLIQEKQIKSKIIGRLFHRLPPLVTIDRMNANILKIGFSCFTLGLLFGILWAAFEGFEFILWPYKEMWAVITWILYALILFGRAAFGWRGRRASWLSISGFIVLMATVLGTTHSVWP